MDFQGVSTLLLSYQQWRCVPLPPRVLSPAFLNLDILLGMMWNLRVILICISPMTKNAEDLFRYFSAIQDSSVVNYLFSSIPIS